MPKKAPKVFISYSHDSVEHKQWVASLARELRGNWVDAVLDQWDLYPGEDVPSFMEKNLSNCEYAILVCTERYVEKANSGKGGVGYEKMIVSAEMVKDIEVSKFIPVIRQSSTCRIPTFIQTKLYLDFSKDEYFEVMFDDLLRTIFRTTISRKPPLGKPPTFGISNVKHTSNTNLPRNAKTLFSALVHSYDSGVDESWTLARAMGVGEFGKIATERALDDLVASSLLEEYSDEGMSEWMLTYNGKKYATEKDLL